MKRPTEFHLATARRVLRYVKGTINFGIFYRKGGNKELIVFMDGDYASDKVDKKSTLGYVFLMSSGAVSWCSTKQTLVTLSTTKAEFIAAASTIRLSKNPLMHGRSKHIDVRFHFLRELVNDGVVELVHCSTQGQVAAILRNPLKFDAFLKLRQLLGVCEYPGLNWTIVTIQFKGGY
ncbi:hypothetical protein Tco_0694380 [Tanacetum coccineum]